MIPFDVDDQCHGERDAQKQADQQAVKKSAAAAFAFCLFLRITLNTMRYLVILLLISFSGFAQKKPDFLTQTNEKWVDSVFNTLTLDEKVGQVLMPRGNFSGRGYEPEKLKEWIRDYKLGGLVFFAGQPTMQAQITNELQRISKVPLMIGVDMEWGLAMRLDSTVRFPFQMATWVPM